MATWLGRTWKRLLAAVDDTLPMPPDQRAERDRLDETSSAEEDRQKLRLKLHLLGKRGRGGFR